jgi:hypothetical protein
MVMLLLKVTQNNGHVWVVLDNEMVTAPNLLTLDLLFPIQVLLYVFAFPSRPLAPTNKNAALCL